MTGLFQLSRPHEERLECILWCADILTCTDTAADWERHLTRSSHYNPRPCLQPCLCFSRLRLVGGHACLRSSQTRPNILFIVSHVIQCIMSSSLPPPPPSQQPTQTACGLHGGLGRLRSNHLLPSRLDGLWHFFFVLLAWRLPGAL